MSAPRRGRVRVVLVLLVIALGGLALTCLFWLRSGPYPRYQQIALGMSEAAVTALLECPPGDYRAEPNFLLVGPGHVEVPADGAAGSPYVLRVWYFDDGHVEVLFDRDGNVAGKYWGDRLMPGTSFRNLLRRILGW
jgi:hypothetical protein